MVSLSSSTLHSPARALRLQGQTEKMRCPAAAMSGGLVDCSQRDLPPHEGGSDFCMLLILRLLLFFFFSFLLCHLLETAHLRGRREEMRMTTFSSVFSFVRESQDRDSWTKRQESSSKAWMVNSEASTCTPRTAAHEMRAAGHQGFRTDERSGDRKARRGLALSIQNKKAKCSENCLTSTVQLYKEAYYRPNGLLYKH